MPKRSEERLLHDEQKVLRLLQTNGKESIDVIAKQCNFSRQKVGRLIKKLEDEKIIWGYSAICDEERYQLKHYLMMIKRTTNALDKPVIDEVLTTRLDDLLPGAVIKMEHIEYTNGCFDGVFTFLAKDLMTAKKFCERFQQHFRKYIASYELLEGIFFIRKQMLRNPQLKTQIDFL